MRMRQEQVVFAVSVAILALLGWNLFQGGETRSRARITPKQAEFVDHPAPPLDAVLAQADVDPPLSRGLFAPPRDTRPLPPLELVSPPRAGLATLFPPPDPGPAPRAFGDWLRLEFEPEDVEGLFTVDAGNEVDLDDTFFGAAAPDTGQDSVIDQLRKALDDNADPFAEEDPAQRAARIEGYKKDYDWILVGVNYQFGRISNKNRFGLRTDPSRADEPFLFHEILPETGMERFEGMDAVTIERERVSRWDFADTTPNWIEVRSREIGQVANRADYGAALAFADECVRRRLEADRALEVAEIFYKQCAAFDRDDPAPRLGLARCYEAGFDFEAAYDEYRSLLEAVPHRAEVHVRLAQLEARFLLFEKAEAGLREALRVDSASWEAMWAMGAFLSDRGRHDEALGHLERAARFAPQDPSMAHVRAEIRLALGRVQLALGNVDDARPAFVAAARAVPGHQVALAGELACDILTGAAGTGTYGSAVGEDRATGFEISIARGLAALRAQEWFVAKDELESAVAADPLRAATAWRAQSFLAEFAGYPEEALRFVEDALEARPDDAWALYQRARLLAARGDDEGARASLLAALELELDFEDALVALGELSFELGAHTDAERYLERAVMVASDRADLHALRGLNFLELGSVPDARGSFESALGADGTHPTARAGLAWCTYLDGDSVEAMVQLANLDEARRAEPEDDAWRVWAKAQLERVRDHLEKVEWSDGFERKRLRNGWDTREGEGIEASMVDGMVRLDGVFQSNARASIYREYPASNFVSLEADLIVSSGSNARAGIFLARERQGRTRNTIAGASVSRHKEGGLQVRFQRKGRTPELTDMQQPFPTDERVRLRIERTGESNDTRITMYMDGIPLVENVPMASIGQAATPLLVGLFVEGEPGRQVSVRMDDVRVVYRSAN